MPSLLKFVVAAVLTDEEWIYENDHWPVPIGPENLAGVGYLLATLIRQI